MDKRQKAKRLAKHYFSLIALEAGVSWSGDNDVEIDELIDAIIDAAKDEILNGPDLPKLIVRGCKQVTGDK